MQSRVCVCVCVCVRGRGPHEMPLVPFSYAFLSLGKDTGAPGSPIARGPH
ncbi:unnamed protein product, partial [Staurois parvus]